MCKTLKCPPWGKFGAELAPIFAAAAAAGNTNAKKINVWEANERGIARCILKYMRVQLFVLTK